MYPFCKCSVMYSFWASCSLAVVSTRKVTVRHCNYNIGKVLVANDKF
jgi:hypothetical protein